MVPSRGSDLNGVPRLILSYDIGHIQARSTDPNGGRPRAVPSVAGQVLPEDDDGGFRRPSVPGDIRVRPRDPREQGNDLAQITNRVDLGAGHQTGLLGVPHGHDNPWTTAEYGGTYRGEDPADRSDPAVQSEFAQVHRVGHDVSGDGPRSGQQGGGHTEIESRPGLGEESR
jgi:hypothetical protein